MTAGAVTGLTLDTGALLALDHPTKMRRLQEQLEASRRRGGALCVPAAVVAQAWRSPRQVRLARLINARDVEVAALTLSEARTVGLMCASSGYDDVVDVHVALCARMRRHAVLTSDPGDIVRIDPTLTLIRV